MKITSARQKRILWELFYIRKVNHTTGQEYIEPIEIDLVFIVDASAAKKRLFTHFDAEKNTFNGDSEIEFSPPEKEILKKLFQEKKKFAVDDADAVSELRTLFDLKPI